MFSTHKYWYWDEGRQKPRAHQRRDEGAAIAASSSAKVTETTKRVNDSLISNWCTAIASTTDLIPRQDTLKMLQRNSYRNNTEKK